MLETLYEFHDDLYLSSYSIHRSLSFMKTFTSINNRIKSSAVRKFSSFVSCTILLTSESKIPSPETVSKQLEKFNTGLTDTRIMVDYVLKLSRCRETYSFKNTEWPYENKPRNHQTLLCKHNKIVQSNKYRINIELVVQNYKNSLYKFKLAIYIFCH